MKPVTRCRSPFVALTVAVALSVSCALTTATPTQPQKTSVRAQTADLVDVFTVAIGIVDEAGYLVTTLPPEVMSVAEKDDFDCEIKRALGDDAPTATVVRICGPVPTLADSKVRKAVTDLQTLTTAPALATTITVALEVFAPLWERMARSKSPRLAALGVILQLTLKPATASIGGVS
jgi:hypothetical protein